MASGQITIDSIIEKLSKPYTKRERVDFELTVCYHEKIEEPIDFSAAINVDEVLKKFDEEFDSDKAYQPSNVILIFKSLIPNFNEKLKEHYGDRIKDEVTQIYYTEQELLDDVATMCTKLPNKLKDKKVDNDQGAYKLYKSLIDKQFEIQQSHQIMKIKEKIYKDNIKVTAPFWEFVKHYQKTGQEDKEVKGSAKFADDFKQLIEFGEMAYEKKEYKRFSDVIDSFFMQCGIKA